MDSNEKRVWQKPVLVDLMTHKKTLSFSTVPSTAEFLATVGGYSTHTGTSSYTYIPTLYSGYGPTS